MSVNLDACIQCGLCVRACREIQVNDVIGMAYRSHEAKIVFDFDDPMGESTCVACGECVQACPTGALMPSVMLDENQTRVTYADRKVELAVSVLRRRLPGHLSGQGREGHLCRRPRRPGQPQPPLRQGPLRFRLHPSPASADKTAGAAAECEEGRQRPGRSGQSVHAFPRSVVGRGAGYRGQGPRRKFATRRASRRWPVSALPKARTKRRICSKSWCAPASAPTMSITARGCATLHPWRR